MDTYKGVQVSGSHLDPIDQLLYEIGYVKYYGIDDNNVEYYQDNVLLNHIRRLSFSKRGDEWQAQISQRILNGEGVWHPCYLDEKEIRLILRKLKRLNKKRKKVKK